MMTETTTLPEKETKRGRPKKILDEAREIIPEQPKIDLSNEIRPKDDYDGSIEIIRDFYGLVDPFYLSKKDPKYAYRFLRATPENLSIKTGNLLFQKGGWQIVSKQHLLKIGIKDNDPGFSSDNTYRKGDTVLAFMPKELFAEKEKFKQEQANSPMSSVQRMIKKGDPSRGGTEIHDSMKGLQTGKQLGMK